MMERVKETIVRPLFPLSPKLFSHTISSLFAKKAELFPSVVYIEGTNACNARCIMCARGTGKMTRSVGTMDFDLFKKIVDECSKNQDKLKGGIVLHLDGEPLFDPLLAKKISYIKEKTNLHVGFSTNASLLDNEKSLELLKSGLDLINFSIDGATKETYEKIRGLEYDCVCNNVNNFLTLKKTLDLKKPIVHITLIKFEDTEAEINEFIKKWKREDVNVFIKEIHDFLDVLPHQEELKTKNKSPCYKIWTEFIISWDGSVPICGWDYNGECIMGDIKSSSIQSIWTSEKYKKIRQMHRLGDITKIAPCNRCPNPLKHHDFPWWWFRETS